MLIITALSLNRIYSLKTNDDFVYFHCRDSQVSVQYIRMFTEKHLQSSKREIALVIEECARFLFRHGMDVEVLAFLRILQRLSKMSYYAKKWNYTSATWDLFRCIRVCSGLLVKQLRFES